MEPTVGQRALLEKFAAGDRPLNRAILEREADLERLCREAMDNLGETADVETSLMGDLSRAITRGGDTGCRGNERR